MMASLLEGATVHYLEKGNKHTNTCTGCFSKNKNGGANEEEQCIVKLSVLQKVSRFLFPLAFVLFNVAYWVYFMRDN